MIHLIFFDLLLRRRRLLVGLQCAGYDSLQEWIFIAFFAVFGILLLFLFFGLRRKRPFFWLKHSSTVRLVVNVRLLTKNMLRKGYLIKQDGSQARDTTHWTSDFSTSNAFGWTRGCECRFSLELSILAHCSTLSLKLSNYYYWNDIDYRIREAGWARQGQRARTGEVGLGLWGCMNRSWKSIIGGKRDVDSRKWREWVSDNHKWIVGCGNSVTYGAEILPFFRATHYQQNL